MNHSRRRPFREANRKNTIGGTTNKVWWQGGLTINRHFADKHLNHLIQ